MKNKVCYYKFKLFRWIVTGYAGYTILLTIDDSIQGKGYSLFLYLKKTVGKLIWR